MKAVIGSAGQGATQTNRHVYLATNQISGRRLSLGFARDDAVLVLEPYPSRSAPALITNAKR